MAASDLISGTAIRYKLGRRAPSESQTPGRPLGLSPLAIHSAAQPPSLNRVAAPDIKSDAAIRASFAGSVSGCSSIELQNKRVVCGSGSDVRDVKQQIDHDQRSLNFSSVTPNLNSSNLLDRISSPVIGESSFT
ncbi:hypothetical protein Pst134EA_013527 [Puccinia striiformis f. sp. tritici]|uniref:hypothetical protein n=1 Tax=Puccinia striiformis f. sp. tritici TaxID=168172 RepID=UPI0020081B20|nr:hypothetical protein Pst134EA_013527 [Puccinia striiformis f. sp. tritici]KAH9454426.1 hypothetical protein Pst134EB_014512 [Puccinia striiformis f. sp. tritici]KAH9465644.1 hypothetical protein Pst134EA_013527 [Puccinia striiformis f. sp. tritici]